MTDNAIYNFVANNGDTLPLKVIDNGDSTYSLLGKSGGIATQVDVTPVLTVHATYVTGDYVGTSGVAGIIAGAARIAGGTGVIKSAVLVDYAKQSVNGEIWVFDSAPTPPADSAAWTLSDADAKKCIGIIPFDTHFISAVNGITQMQGNYNIGFKCATGSTSLYFCYVTRGSPAYASGDLTFRFNIWQD